METSRKRPWWQRVRLSVRGLMLVVLAVGSCLGWWLHLTRVQKRAVAVIRAAGGWVSYAGETPDGLIEPAWRQWLAVHVDVDLSDNVVSANLTSRCGDAELAQVARLVRLETLFVQNANVTDANTALLGRLRRLRRLYLHNRPITDAGLVHLERLTGLEELALDCTPVTDAGLAHLKGLTKLRALNLKSTQVGDAGLASLEGLANLQDLILTRTKVGDAGLAHLKRLRRLRRLWLDRTWITDAGLVHLAETTSLKLLDFSGTQVFDRGFVHLSSLVEVTYLDLSQTPVSDVGTAHLSRMTRMRSLNLSETRITDATLAYLTRMTAMFELSLSKTRITDAGLEKLAGLTSLTTLSISGTQVSDAGLRYLEGLKQLHFLATYHSRVTAAGESQIKNALPQLDVQRLAPGEEHAEARTERPLEPGGGSTGPNFTPDDRFYVNVYSADSKAEQKDLISFASDVVIPRLRQIKGTDVPKNLANPRTAVRILMDPDRMRAHAASVRDVKEAFARSSMGHRGERPDGAAGTVWQSKPYQLICIGRGYAKLSQHANIVIRANPDGEILRVRDVCQSAFAPPFFDVSSDIDGHPATTIVLKRLPNWSGAIATEAIEKELTELKATAFPPGVNFEVIPLDHRNMIYAAIEIEKYSTPENTSAKCHELGAIARDIEGVSSVVSLAGYEFRREGHGLGAATCLIRLKDRSDRKITSREILEKLEEKSRTMNVDIKFFESPAVSVFNTAGGFSVRVLDKANSASDGLPGSGAETFMDRLLKHKNLRGLFTFLSSHYPRHELLIDNGVAREKGVSIADALENLIVIMGDDPRAEGTFARVAEDFSNRWVKNERGEMVPYYSFLELEVKPRLDESDR